MKWHGPDLPRVPAARRARGVRGLNAYRDKATVVRADYAWFHKLNIPLTVLSNK